MLRSVSSAMTAGIAALAVLAMLMPALLPRRSGVIRPSQGAFLLTTLAVGPGIIINGILKNFWGRARPRDTLDFGGDLPFTPAWTNADHCSGNCSFVSGEASAAIWLVALTFVVPGRFRMPVLFAALSFAAAASTNRIAFGAHYLSDVVIAWAITLAVVAFGRWIVLDGRRSEAIDAVFAGALRFEDLTSTVSPTRNNRNVN